MEYGARLTGVVVKYAAEASKARETLATSVQVIPNGIPLTRACRRTGVSRLVIGTAARISADKRLDQLLEAVRIAQPKLGEFELRIAGGPDAGNPIYFRELRQSARDLPVRWLGHLDDVSGFLANLDIFAMISEPAGCPNASLEAMAAGLPMIATDHGGASEQVIDGVNGRLVPRADTRAFADALVALAGDPATRLSMGIASRERIESTFSLERMVDTYSALLGLAPK
jgi:glycosyltransferase involved in cell wall biosynthesis